MPIGPCPRDQIHHLFAGAARTSTHSSLDIGPSELVTVPPRTSPATPGAGLTTRVPAGPRPEQGFPAVNSETKRGGSEVRATFGTASSQPERRMERSVPGQCAGLLDVTRGSADIRCW